MARKLRVRTLLRSYRIEAIVLGVGVAAAVLTGVWMRADAWAALGQWIGAAGTVVAVMVALRIAQREAAAEADHARSEKAEREIEQARLVTAEMVYPDPDDIMSPYGVEYADAVRITNHSITHVFTPRVEGPIRTLPIIGFTDAAGRRWRRAGPATPVRVAEDDDYQVGSPSWSLFHPAVAS